MALRDIWQYILHDLGWAAAVGYDRHTMPHHEDEEESFIREVEEVLWRDRAREEGRVRGARRLALAKVRALQPHLNGI